MNPDIAKTTDLIGQQATNIETLKAEIAKMLVGQEKLMDRMLIALLTGGHILLEGVPGLAKTMAVKTLAQALGLKFHRISFTPDLLPADVVGTMIYSPKDGTFTPKRGPVFTNLLLADVPPGQLRVRRTEHRGGAQVHPGSPAAGEARLHS